MSYKAKYIKSHLMGLWQSGSLLTANELLPSLIQLAEAIEETNKTAELQTEVTRLKSEIRRLREDLFSDSGHS